MPLTRPVHIAFSYDEEIGCRGVGHMIERLPALCARPAGASSGSRPRCGRFCRTRASRPWSSYRGRAGHSSNPALGENALYPAAELLLFIRDRAARLAAEGRSTRVSAAACDAPGRGHPGGNAINIIPDRA